MVLDGTLQKKKKSPKGHDLGSEQHGDVGSRGWGCTGMQMHGDANARGCGCTGMGVHRDAGANENRALRIKM